jgi:DNA replication licensing factor MCM3
LFIILDQIDPQHDRDISQHVLRMHTYRRPGEEDGTPVEDLYDKMYEVDVENEEETPIYEKMNGIVSGRGGRRKDLFSLVFLKKYIQYAKARVKPTLSKEAMEADLGMKHQTLPITARTLETMIRLSTAHAKVRLSSIVEQVRHRLFRTKHIRRQLVDIL